MHAETTDHNTIVPLAIVSVTFIGTVIEIDDNK